MPSIRYDAYQPQLRLQPIGPEIWIVEGPVLGWGYGLPLKWPFPTRMTVVRLSGGGLWLHSPVEAGEDVMASVAALGPVEHIVSPNMLHHVSIACWAKRFPAALLWASPGVRKRSSIRFTGDLADRPDAAWSRDIDQRIARGSSVLEEVVFFHRPSKTLILTDLIENFEGERLHSRIGRLVCRLTGIMAPHGRAPIDMRLTFRGRHGQLRPTIEWMLACQPERIVISHGRWFRENGTAAVRRGFSWVKGVDWSGFEPTP